MACNTHHTVAVGKGQALPAGREQIIRGRGHGGKAALHAAALIPDPSPTGRRELMGAGSACAEGDSIFNSPQRQAPIRDHAELNILSPPVERPLLRDIASVVPRGPQRGQDHNGDSIPNSARRRLTVGCCVGSSAPAPSVTPIRRVRGSCLRAGGGSAWWDGWS